MAALGYLLAKELKQFRRDPFMPKLAFIFPVMIMLVMPLIATMDVKNVKLAVVDDDRSTLSESLVKTIESSEYFIIKAMPHSYEEAMTLIDDGTVDVIMQIPGGAERDVVNGRQVDVFIAANAVNSTKGSIGAGYLNSIVSSFPTGGGASVSAPVSISIQNVYNRYQNYRLFMVPALLIMVMIAICSFLPTLNIVSEKEKGTIEQINVTPVSKMEFILSKLLFYGILGILIFTITFLVGKAIYGIAPYGGYSGLYLAAVLFILFMAGFGLTVSNYSNTLQQAVFVTFFFMMIFVLMSGLFTPVTSMVKWAYDFTFILPSRYFIEIMRAVCLKGSSIRELWFQFMMLGIGAFLMDTVAIITYRKQS